MANSVFNLLAIAVLLAGCKSEPRGGTARGESLHGGSQPKNKAAVVSPRMTSVTLAWNLNPEPDVIGYRLHYGTQTGIYSTKLDAGNSTTLSVPNLTEGTTYFFAATAYKASGFESKFSDEVSTIAGSSQTPTPTVPPTPSPTPVNGKITLSPATVNFTGTVGGPFPLSKGIQVTTSNGSDWSSSDKSPWFDAHPTSGPSGTSTILEPHTDGLRVGSYSQVITFFAGGSPDKSLTVKLKMISGASPTPARTPTPAPPPTPTCTPCNCGK